jgi:glucose-1-phosphate thymidylyltransferase
MTNRKGIILAGGSGTRLHPLTLATSKQLLPVYDKPMVYYPLTTLMLAGIRDILVISTPVDLPQYQKLLGDGSQWGIRLSYKEQPSPDGLAQAYILGEEFLDGSPSLLILGDNIFYGHGLPELLQKADKNTAGATVFGYHVADPERYGVVDFDENGRVRSIVEKPELPASNYAVTGLYFADETAPSRAREVKPSPRGELEIISVLKNYLDDASLKVEVIGRGYAWLDTGTHTSLLDAGNFVRTMTLRQGLQIGSPIDVARKMNYVNAT